MRKTSDYVALTTQANNQQTKFAATIALTVQPFVDGSAVVASLPHVFDLDFAVGVQLDAVGVRVGITRHVSFPITGVYFALNTAGLGFDQGAWFGPNNPTSGITNLDDETYRTLLRAKVAANSWDGTASGAQMVLQTILQGKPGYLFIEDHQDMTMVIGLSGPLPDRLTQALLTSSYIQLVPAGVQVRFIVTSGSGPVFGFDVENQFISGFDVGAWGKQVS